MLSKILKETRVPAEGEPISAEAVRVMIVTPKRKIWVDVQILEASKKKPIRVAFFPSEDCETFCIPLQELLKALDIVR